MFDREEFHQWWISELRFGTHRQGQGALHLKDSDNQDEDFLCCLGVGARELARRGLISARDNDECEEGLLVEYDGNTSVFSLRVQELLGVGFFGSFELHGLDPVFREELDRYSVNESNADLVYLNDAGMPHARIADLIEHIDKKGLWASLLPER